MLVLLIATLMSLSEPNVGTYLYFMFGTANSTNADWTVNGNAFSNGYYTIGYITRPSESNTLNFRIISLMLNVSVVNNETLR